MFCDTCYMITGTRLIIIHVDIHLILIIINNSVVDPIFTLLAGTTVTMLWGMVKEPPLKLSNSTSLNLIMLHWQERVDLAWQWAITSQNIYHWYTLNTLDLFVSRLFFTEVSRQLTTIFFVSSSSLKFTCNDLNYLK